MSRKVYLFSEETRKRALDYFVGSFLFSTAAILSYFGFTHETFINGSIWARGSVFACSLVFIVMGFVFFFMPSKDDAERQEKAKLDGFKKLASGRNGPCPCGSAKKFKKCCGA